MRRSNSFPRKQDDKPSAPSLGELTLFQGFNCQLSGEDSSQTSISSQNPPQWSCGTSSSRCPPGTATSHVPTRAHLDHTSAPPPHSPSHWQPYILRAAKGGAPRNSLASALALTLQSQLIAWSCQPPWTRTPLLPWTHRLAQATRLWPGSVQQPPHPDPGSSWPLVLSSHCSQRELINLQSPLLLNAL